MNIAEIGEVFFITPIENVSSILSRGILSHEGAARVSHRSVASPVIQDRRAKVTVPGGMRLHSYANLYFCQRNPMMIKILREFRFPHDELAVLRVSPEVFYLSGTVIADGNASSDYTRFDPAPTGVAALDGERIHAEWWSRYVDERLVWEHRRVKCAEVLVPAVVDPTLVLGAFASCDRSGAALGAIMAHHDIKIEPYGFFR